MVKHRRAGPWVEGTRVLVTRPSASIVRRMGYKVPCLTPTPVPFPPCGDAESERAISYPWTGLEARAIVASTTSHAVPTPRSRCARSAIDSATGPLTEGSGGGAGLSPPRRYARLARQLTTLVAEVTEQTERVDNALQVTEDVYLARVYAAAMALFRVPVVGAAVDRKLSVIRDTYRGLYEEASATRAELLEVAIVLLIVSEIVLSFVRH